MKIANILEYLSSARAEYHSDTHSVYNKFVVPYFIDECNLSKISHSVSLEGSRGSGKSTYIKYFCHSTRFDKNLNDISKSEFDCIILYWKPDTAYCQGLNPNWLGEDANLIFKIHAGISILDEFCTMLVNTSYHFPQISDDIKENQNFFSAVSKITRTEIQTLKDLESWINTVRYDLSVCLNPFNIEQLTPIEPKEALNFMVRALKIDCKLFKNTIFRIYVDEFELLSEYQQKIINTYRKESNYAVSWNVAYKKNAKPTSKTTSDQWLQQPDDYRAYDIDSLLKDDFKIFAAEVFLLTLKNSGLRLEGDNITESFLGDKNNIKFRKSKEYESKIIGMLERIFPTPSIKSLSEYCLGKDYIKNEIIKHLKHYKVDLDVQESILNDPSLALTLLGTINQKRFDISDFIEAAISENKSKKIKDKIGTFEFNTILNLNLRKSQLKAPVYAGFDRFITMTSPNVRHFKELCFSSLKNFNEENSGFELNSIDGMPCVALSSMHYGAIQTSNYLVDEIISYPPFGKKLSQMVNRLGEIFTVSQKTVYQTEPERNIFILDYDFSGDDGELEKFLDSAICWRVLIKDQSKRNKSDNTVSAGFEFQLNPIYSPRFGISYRKKRHVSLDTKTYKWIIGGSHEVYEPILRRYQKYWKADREGSTIYTKDLFS